MNDVEVNSKGTNKAIKFNILNDESMKKAGFRFVESLNLWYLCKPIKHEITFNVSIPLDKEAWIDVLDDDFGQPYDYQYMLEHSPKQEFANYVKEKVEGFMSELIEAGIIEGHEYGEYI